MSNVNMFRQAFTYCTHVQSFSQLLKTTELLSRVSRRWSSTGFAAPMTEVFGLKCAGNGEFLQTYHATTLEKRSLLMGMISQLMFFA
jgi:hypothetical protein